jgi:hypothetical protein
MVGLSARAPAAFTPQGNRVTRQFHNKDVDFYMHISNMRFPCKVLFYIQQVFGVLQKQMFDIRVLGEQSIDCWNSAFSLAYRHIAGSSVLYMQLGTG